MFSDCLANNLGSIAKTDLVDKSGNGCRGSVQNVHINSSMREDGLYKLTENFCPLLTDNLMNFFDPGIEPKDDKHMHKFDSNTSSDVTEVEYASLPDILWSFSDKDCIICSLNTEDTIDDIPNSQLLDSPLNVPEDPSFHGDEQDVGHSEDDVEPISIPHLNPVQLSEGEIICTLNTEDPEIPCNDNISLLISPSPVKPQAATDSINLASSFTQSPMYCVDLSSDIDSAHSHVGNTLKSVPMDHNPSISDHNYDSDLHCFRNIGNPDIPSLSVTPQTATDSTGCASYFTQSQMDGPHLSSEFNSEHPHVGITHISPSVNHKPSISDDPLCFPDTADPVIPSPPIRPQTALDFIEPASYITPSHIDGLHLSCEFDVAHSHVGSTLESVSVDRIPSVSDRNNSDSDSDPPCFPDIEALVNLIILLLMCIPYFEIIFILLILLFTLSDT